MINNVEELLDKANEFSSEEDKVKYIMNYFFNTVQYNYALLFMKGYTQGTISVVSNNLTLDYNKTRTDEDEEFSLCRSIITGESRIFNEILKLRDENTGNYNKFINELRSYIMSELSSHLGNESLVSQNTEYIINKIEQELREKNKFNIDGTEIYANNDISKVLIDFLLKYRNYFPPEFRNGLITKGVCRDYTDYIYPILQKAGIESHKIDGKSVFSHSWIIAKVDNEYKSIDLTRTIFIRDGGLEIPKEQTSEDWLYSDIESIFKMQETRSITRIDGKELPTPVTGQNYDPDIFARIINGQDFTDSTFKNLLKRGLEKGITEAEVQNAEKAQRSEKTKEEDGKINE